MTGKKNTNSVLYSFMERKFHNWKLQSKNLINTLACARWKNVLEMILCTCTFIRNTRLQKLRMVLKKMDYVNQKMKILQTKNYLEYQNSIRPIRWGKSHSVHCTVKKDLQIKDSQITNFFNKFTEF